MSAFNLPGGSPELKTAIERFLRQILSFPFRVWRVATADLPTATTDNEGGLYWNTTDKRFGASNGTAHIQLQSYDATLAALAAYNTNGFLVQTAADTFVGRTLAAPAAGFTITNPAGTAGNPTFVLANDLAALEGLASTGIAVRSAADTWVQRTITGTANEITVTNGSGASGNPTLSLPTALTFTSKTVTGGTITGLSNLGAGNSDFTDPIAGTAKTKFQDGNMVLSFRDNSSGQGYVAVTNGTMTGFLGHTNTAQGFTMGAVSDHAVTIRQNNLGVIHIDADGNVGIGAFSTTAPGSMGALLDVQGSLRCDSLRIDVAPTAATPTPTHTVPININGTVYRFPCVI